jgi:pantetheine-phosphate adenylyltransferase
MRIAVYAGTFDPITRGHLSVIDRASRLFDRLFVLVAVNPFKQPLFSPEERVEMITETTRSWPGVSGAATAGYVATFARDAGARYLVRGVRSCIDVEGEITLAHLNRALAPEIETVFIPAHPELSEVSSSRLKELALEGQDLEPYCPPGIALRLLRRLREARETSEESARV